MNKTIYERQIADLEAELQRQVERAERAEAALKKARDQEPALYISFRHDDETIRWWSDEPPKGVSRYPIRRFYAAPAPAVPDEWREVMTELAADLQAACDAEHPHRDQYPSVMRKYNNDMEIVEKARALLQSDEGCSSQTHSTQAQNGGAK